MNEKEESVDRGGNLVFKLRQELIDAGKWELIKWMVLRELLEQQTEITSKDLS